MQLFTSVSTRQLLLWYVTP